MRRLTEQDIANIIGSKIEGHRVEAARIKDGPYADSDNYGFILARDDHGCYVTWQFHLLEDGTVTAYWGHYFGNDRDAAVQDFETRDKG